MSWSWQLAFWTLPSFSTAFKISTLFRNILYFVNLLWQKLHIWVDDQFLCLAVCCLCLSRSISDLWDCSLPGCLLTLPVYEYIWHVRLFSACPHLTWEIVLCLAACCLCLSLSYLWNYSLSIPNWPVRLSFVCPYLTCKIVLCLYLTCEIILCLSLSDLWDCSLSVPIWPVRLFSVCP